jgi:hypothetical protein
MRWAVSSSMYSWLCCVLPHHGPRISGVKDYELKSQFSSVRYLVTGMRKIANIPSLSVFISSQTRKSLQTIIGLYTIVYAAIVTSKHANVKFSTTYHQ